MEFSSPIDTAVGVGLVKLSPNGARIAHLENPNIVLRETDGLKLDITLTCSEPLSRIEWAPNSSYILGVSARRAALLVWNSAKSQVFAAIDCGRSGLAFARWAPNSTHLLTVSEFGLNCIVWSINSKDIKQIRPPKSSACITFSPEGDLLAIGDRKDCKDYVTIYSTANFEMITCFPVATQDLTQLNFAPDGASLIGVDTALEYRVLSIDVDGGRSIREFSAYKHQLGVKAVDISAKRKLIAIGSFDQKLRLLSALTWRCVGECAHPAVVRSKSTVVYQQSVITQGEGTRSSNYVVEALPFRVPQVKPLMEPNAKLGIGQLSWSPDAALIASRNGDAFAYLGAIRSHNMPTAVWVWDAHTLALLALLNHIDPVRSLEWHPFSSRLAISTGSTEFFLWTPEGACCVESPVSIQSLKWRIDGKALLLQDKTRFSCCYFSDE